MSKTAPIHDDIHTLITDKQRELKEKYKITVKISDIIALVVKNNIDKVGKYLGLKGEEESDNAKSDITVSTKSDITVSAKPDIIDNMKPCIISNTKSDIIGNTKSDIIGNTKSDIIGDIVQGDVNNQGVKTKDNGHASGITEDGVEIKT